MLKGKTALVTGSTSGIGLAIARAMAKDGANLVINGFGDKGAIEKERTGLEKEFGIKAVYSGADMSKPDEIADMVAKTEKDLGSLDVLVNNAGIAISGPITQLSLADWKRQESINLGGVFLGIKHGLPLLRASGGGSIVNVASTTALGGSGNLVSYAATKGGVCTLTKSVALQCAAAKDGVRVNTVLPGIIGTPIYDSFEGPATQRDDRGNLPLARDPDALAKAFVPLGVKGQPADIAGGILYLASDDAKYVTGIDLVIDGGLVLG